MAVFTRDATIRPFATAFGELPPCESDPVVDALITDLAGKLCATDQSLTAGSETKRCSLKSPSRIDLKTLADLIAERVSRTLEKRAADEPGSILTAPSDTVVRDQMSQTTGLGPGDLGEGPLRAEPEAEN